MVLHVPAGRVVVASNPTGVIEAERALAYETGFGNTFASEAVAGALPVGRNSPQRPPHGLYAEQLSATSFTTPREHNRRSWLYRIRPTAAHRAFRRIADGRILGAPFDTAPTPNRLRWDPLPAPPTPADFIDGLFTFAGNGDIAAQTGIAIHLYAINASMRDRVFANADGELLLVPQHGTLRIATEFGRLDAPPGWCAVIPRGVRFRVEIDGDARGYVCENYGESLRLPELGPLGANGLANARDFETPVAWFEDVERPTEVVLKFQGRLWATELPRSPLDVVAWHGNLAPYRYDLARFNAMGTVSFDHPDPSIYTVLTSPSGTLGVANVDFVIFPPRWLVGEDTFRPPWFHRNVMSEYMGLVHGAYDAKAEGFVPGGGSLHNRMSAHGPDAASWKRASDAVLRPEKLDGTLAFMFESRYPIAPVPFALESPLLQRDYDAVWDGFPANFRT